MRLRSKRSTKTPATRPTSTLGAAVAISIRPTLAAEPVFEGDAVGKGKTLQKGAAVHLHGRAQVLDDVLKSPHIGLDIGGAVDLHAGAVDQQKGRLGPAVADAVAQPGEGVAQVVLRRFLAVIRPEQVDQLFPAVRAVVFHRQVSQQGAGFVGFKTNRRISIQLYLETAQKSHL